MFTYLSKFEGACVNDAGTFIYSENILGKKKLVKLTDNLTALDESPKFTVDKFTWFQLITVGDIIPIVLPVEYKLKTFIFCLKIGNNSIERMYNRGLFTKDKINTKPFYKVIRRCSSTIKEDNKFIETVKITIECFLKQFGIALDSFICI